MFHSVFIEVSGICNARCPYCYTGSRHGDHVQNMNPFMSAQLFQDVTARLRELNFIGKDSCVHLYNWGEPFLNPEIKDILSHLHGIGNKFVISTNAGFFPKLPRSLFKNLSEIVISMPGFRQASYDKIHGLRLDKVLLNVERIIDTVGNRRVNVCMHAYKFNTAEIDDARAYFRKRGVLFTVYPAFFNDYNQTKAYLTGSLPEAFLARAMDELILEGQPALLASRPEDYVCPQFDMLTVDEKGQLVTCCLAPKTSADYAYGTPFELTGEEILERKVTRNLCKECSALKIDYWVHASPTYSSDAFYRLPGGRLRTGLWHLKKFFS